MYKLNHAIGDIRYSSFQIITLGTRYLKIKLQPKTTPDLPFNFRFNPYSAGAVFILAYKDGPRTERIQIFLMVVDP